MKTLYIILIFGAFLLLSYFALPRQKKSSSLPIFVQNLWSPHDLDPSIPRTHYDKWLIVTSINYPTSAIRRLAALPGWHTLIVADTKSPKNWTYENCTYLSMELQEKLPYNIMKYVPFKHYGRKNIGYLFAIMNGARIIYETDDDNILIEDVTLESAFLPHEVSDIKIYAETNRTVVNVYEYFGQPSVWPRGFPLDQIGDKDHIDFSRAEKCKIGIQQGLANGDPDVDAIYRLTQKNHKYPINLTFQNVEPVVLPHQVMSPFNSQNTLFHYETFWGLLIPVTTAFRVCDIWRGYWAQRLLRETDEHLAFFTASVFQKRNAHNYLLDFIDEKALYYDVPRLISFLNAWTTNSNSFFGSLTELSEAMYEQGFWDAHDALLARAWVHDLQAMNYTEPLVKHRTTNESGSR